MSFSVVLASLKTQARAVGVSEESFFLQQLHKISAGADPTVIQNLVNYANSLGMVATAAIIQDLLESSKKIAQAAVDIKSGYLTVTGSDNIIVPVGFLVDELFVDFVSPSDPSYITCAPSNGDTVQGELLVHSNVSHNLKITWTVNGTRTIKWLVKQ
jgi:hypothetical protein